MKDKFIIARLSDERNGKYRKLNISEEAYQQIAEWAEVSGKSMSKILSMAVAFAADHCVIIDE